MKISDVIWFCYGWTGDIAFLVIWASSGSFWRGVLTGLVIKVVTAAIINSSPGLAASCAVSNVIVIAHIMRLFSWRSNGKRR